ncbi:MAG TPA: ATPase P [Proteobacteria bacterium]|nr:ATPase P [Pseudomonadota bacterium]
MIKIRIPGWKEISLFHLVLDMNGTLTLDGRLIEGVEGNLLSLSSNISIHILTADTFGTAHEVFRDLPVSLDLIPGKDQIRAKEAFLQGLEGDAAAMGNGRNDAGMLGSAAVGIAILGPEGAASQTVQASDVVVRGVNDGLGLLLNPGRLVATLRR